MLRSLYSGVSGMKANQTKLDVIGNNVANVGTTAFKSSRVRFQDTLSQTVNPAMAATQNTGGINPSAVGTGVRLAGIDTIVSQGSLQPTSRNLDMAVDGEGYFMVFKGETVFNDTDLEIQEGINANGNKNTLDNENEEKVFFTRDGSFTLDSEGNLLTSDGYRVLGYSVKDATNSSIAGDGTLNYVDATSTALVAEEDLRTLKIPDVVMDTTSTPATPLRVLSFVIEKDGLIKAVCEGNKFSVLGQVAMASFKNPAGLDKLGSNLYQYSANSGEAVVRTGLNQEGNVAVGELVNNSEGYGDIVQGMLEMSNVDLTEQFTDMIVTTRAFQASSKMITTGDEILQDIINLKR